MALDPVAATSKWATRLQGATTQIQEGVNAVQTAPGVLAAQKADVWLAKLQASQAKWKKNVAAVSLQSWQNAMNTLGIQHIQSGVTAKQGNYQAFATKFYPYLQSGKASIDAMPKVTLQDGINKAIKQITYNAAYTGGGGRNS